MYSFAVIYDLVPAVFVIILICFITRSRFKPPKAAQLRQEVMRRRERSKEAQHIGKDFQRRSEFGALGNLAASASLAGIMASSVVDNASSKSDFTSNMSRIAQQKLAQLSGETKARSGFFGLMRDLTNRFGPVTQMYMEE